MVSSGVQAERVAVVVVGKGEVFTVLSVQFVDNLRPVAPSSHSTQPSVGKLGEPRSRNGSYPTRVDCVRHQMNRQYEQCGCRIRPAEVVETESWQRHDGGGPRGGTGKRRRVLDLYTSVAIWPDHVHELS